MYALARPLLFALDPHTAHALASLAIAPLEHSSILRALVRPRFDAALRTQVLGLDFPTPVGLAGGFDKNALRPRALAALGFGFLELGTVTARPQDENPRPNLHRLPEDRALVNRLGFPNDGAATVAARVRKKRGGIPVPVGISIGKSRSVPLDPIDGAIADYVESFQAVRSACDFVVVNVSSPNTKDLRAMQGADIARALFSALKKADEEASLGRAGRSVPILIKIAPDLSDAELESLLAVVEELEIPGVVATNTTLSREGVHGDASALEGGLSGPPLHARSVAMVRKIRARLGARTAIIGVGGIETGADAVDFIRAGADLVQLYTAFVYRGPRAAALIAREALAIARKDGAASLADLVGRG
jgi:dihydroorotate dehydrogenase